MREAATVARAAALVARSPNHDAPDEWSRAAHEFGLWLQRMRARMGMSLRAGATVTGLRPEYIALVESGRLDPRSELPAWAVERLAHMVGYGLAELRVHPYPAGSEPPDRFHDVAPGEIVYEPGWHTSGQWRALASPAATGTIYLPDHERLGRAALTTSEGHGLSISVPEGSSMKTVNGDRPPSAANGPVRVPVPEAPGRLVFAV